MSALAPIMDQGVADGSCAGRPQVSRTDAETACDACRRRAWLFARCGARLDHRSRDLERFWELISLSEAALIEAIGGRRRAEIRAAYDRLDPQACDFKGPPALDARAICRHCESYPARLCESALAPHALSIAGAWASIGASLGREPAHPADSCDRLVVAIVGTRRSSDYGFQTARGLAHDLGCAGVAIAGALGEGIATAALSGALEAAGSTIAVMAGGLGTCSPRQCLPLFRRLLEDGSVLSEIPPAVGARRWSALARNRTLALLADLVIVVEAERNPYELACARLAQRLGRKIAAIPGRVNSPLARGCHELILGGATLLRDAHDALDVLHDAAIPPCRDALASKEILAPGLLAVFERVASGEETLDALLASPAKRADVLSALVELELRGLIARGLGGRYVACRP